MLRTILIALCACATFAYAQPEKPETKPEEKPAMELGGIVTADFYSRLDSIKSPHLEIGYVELGATVNISEEVIAAISIAAVGNLADLYINQAVVSYKPKNASSLELLFGQHLFYHGLLTTRLISDPLILDDVEIRAPGICLNFTKDIFTIGAAFNMRNADPEPAVSTVDTILSASGLDTVFLSRDEAVTETRRDYAGVINLDLSLPSESVARLSSLISGRFIDLDLAFTANIATLAIDGEIWHQVYGRESPREGGYYLGVSVTPMEPLTISIRHDGLSGDRFKELTTRYAGGITVNVKDGIYWAFEFAHVVDKNNWKQGYQEIALQIGLRQTLQLPGFQRRTLATE